MNNGNPARSVPEIRATGARDPVTGLGQVAEYLTKGEAKLADARTLRRELLAAARTQDPPVTWRRLVEVTGASEPFLRSELAKHLDPPKRTHP